MKQTQLFLTDLESARAAFAVVKTNSKVPQYAAEARSSINRAGRWRHLHLSAACLVLAILALVGAAFAPMGIWPSIWGIATAVFVLLAVFWTFDYDPHASARLIEDLDVRVKQDVALAEIAGKKTHDGLLTAAQAQIDRYISSELGAGTGFTTVTEALARAADPVRDDLQAVSTHVAQKRKDLTVCEKDLSDLRLILDHRVWRWWPTRLWPAFTQGLVRKIVSAIERAAAARLCLLAEQFNLQLQESTAALLTGAHVSKLGESGSEADSLARRLEAEWKEALKPEQLGAPCLKLVPKVSEIENDVVAAVDAALPVIRKAIAGRSQDQSVEDVVRAEAERIVAALGLPDTFERFFARRNGDKSAFLEQLDAQAREQAVTEPTPGQESIRLRLILVARGNASAVFKDITAHSPGMFIQALHQQDQRSCVVLTSTDMVPIGSNTEYLKALPASLNLSREKRAAALVACDPAIICGFTPERGTQAADALHTVTLALVFGILERTGAERYREVDPLDHDSEPFAAGFDQCVEVVANTSDLATRIQDRLESTFASQGGDALKTRLSAALQNKDLVPAAALKRCRQVIAEEISRFGSAHPALAA